MKTSPVLNALRLATADLHRDIEAESRIESRLRETDSRPAMVARFLDFHHCVETAVEPWRDALDDGGFALRRRTPEMQADLELLGGEHERREGGSAAPTLGEALGWLYVAEGSMLGGRVIRRGLAKDGVPLTGLGFLDPCGDATGERWSAFVTAMESACASGRALQADVLKGGRDAFTRASALLAPHRPTESAA
ncbi:biliverdin-producing heme oxygenase [Brevundimonas sp.]|uniref:biliverdin-producing heme oxygenase n=1 Tax=Brevundimonas sp. TaxID=1871086 RepID=UPI0035ADB616